jgi:hypothetical protein
LGRERGEGDEGFGRGVGECAGATVCEEERNEYVESKALITLSAVV